jgi:hypothetical protein
MSGFVLLIGTLVLYFLPAIVASRRKHHNSGAIFALNLLLGWTVLGWIVALVWACTAVNPPPVVYQHVSTEAKAIPRYPFMCRNCRMDNVEGAEFCNRCGHSLKYE